MLSQHILNVRADREDLVVGTNELYPPWIFDMVNKPEMNAYESLLMGYRGEQVDL